MPAKVFSAQPVAGPGDLGPGQIIGEQQRARDRERLGQARQLQGGILETLGAAGFTVASTEGWLALVLEGYNRLGQGLLLSLKSGAGFFVEIVCHVVRV